MPIEVTTLSEIDADRVDQALERTVQIVKEAHPSLDVRRGVVGRLLTRLNAILGGADQTQAELFLRSSSLLNISEDPALAEDDVVDAVISNYGLSRRSATFASGEVTVVIDREAAVTVAAGAVWEANGQQYVADAAYAARINAASVIANTDRLLTQIGTDRYAFTISVIAVEAGQSGQAQQGDRFVPLNPPLGFVSAYATSDFANAVDSDTNEDLLRRQAEGMSARTISNRRTLAAMIRNSFEEQHEDSLEAFAEISDLSSVGVGDHEMSRDRHGLIPSSTGGRIDLYLRSQPLYSLTALEKTATLIEKTADGGIWQFSIGRDEAPGFYEVSSVRISDDPEDDSFEVTETVRGLDLTGDDPVPDIETAQEAAFSRYQTATIRFLDTVTSTAGLTVNESTADYSVSVAVMPLVAELQTYLSNRQTACQMGDLLVKAAIPCFLAISIQVERRRTSATIDTATITSELVAYINRTGFPGKLYASDLQKIVGPLLPANVSVRGFVLEGRLLKPDGTIDFIRDAHVLTVPADYDNFCSGRTVAFFVSPADIAIDDSTVEIPAV